MKSRVREQQELSAKDYVSLPELSARIAASSLELSRFSDQHQSNLLSPYQSYKIAI